MVDSELMDLFLKQSIDKQLEITYSGGTITNSELFDQSMELTESLCSESELRFGSCEASQIKFKIANVFLPMFDQKINVQMKLEGYHDTPFPIGAYKVASDTPTADREWRDIVAYDAMYDILNSDVADWYNTVLPDEESQMTMRVFRKRFLEHFGMEEADPEQELVNDSMIVQKTILPEELSGKDVITSICEINACFGHINREGKFAYIYLPQMIQGLYPANDLYPDHAPDYLPYQQDTGHLYPQNPKGTPIGPNGTYISCQYEDYLVKRIDKLRIRQEEEDIGTTFPNEEPKNSDNLYIVEDNFLVYGKSAEELNKIAENMYKKMENTIYRPYSAETQGNPCLEVGDPIRFSTRYEIVESYIFERTLKGIQALKDSLSAKGSETYPEELNSVQKSIIQLKGKTNTLTRTVEETNSTITDVEKGLRSEITQTADKISTDIQNTKEGLESSIEQTAGEIRTEVKESFEDAKSYTDGVKGNVLEEVAETLGGYPTKVDMQSSIDQTAFSITSKVGGAMSKYDESGYAGRITLYGYESPTIAGYSESEHRGEYYLNQSDGKLYYSTGSSWVYQISLQLITETLSTEIKQLPNSIELSVNQTLTGYPTKSDLNSSLSNYPTKNDLTTSLSSYPTKVEMNSAIDIKVDSITQTVSKSVRTYDTTGYKIDYYGYGTPAASGIYNKIPETATKDEYYLNQELGNLYRRTSGNKAFSDLTTLKTIQESLSSKIEQNAESIKLKVSGSDVESLIEQKADSIRLKAGKISWESTYSSMTEDGHLTCTAGTFNGSLTSEVNPLYAKIDKARLEIGRTTISGYIDGNNAWAPDGTNGVRLAGLGGVFILAPRIGVTGYQEGGTATVDVGQDTSTKIITDIKDNGDGTISWDYKTITFRRGLMVTALT